MVSSAVHVRPAVPATRFLQKIDWLAALRNLLQTLAFCLAVGSLQFYLAPSRSYQVPLVYSIATGVPIWAIIEFGRFALTRGTEKTWPHGPVGIGLIGVAIVAGYFIGLVVGDSWFGWSSWNQSQDKIVSTLVVSLVAGLVATTWFYLRGRSAALSAEAQTAQRQAAESRLKLLQSQLDPHMLFNTLANLRSLIASDPDRATAMLDRLNDYLRATLTASRATMHPLSAEFDRLRDYLELMAVRMGPRLRYSLHLPPDLADLPVPTLLLQPLVENSIQHGLEPKVEGGEVIVSVHRDGAVLLLEVSDSGVGRADSNDLAGAGTTNRPGTGFGLTQVRERLLTAYGSAASIEFARDEQNRWRATIRVRPAAWPQEPAL